LAEAKTSLSKPIAIRLTNVQLRGSRRMGLQRLSRVQRQQVRGQVGVAEKQRKGALRQLGTAETAFNKEVTSIEKDFKTAEQEIAAYRRKSAEIAKENAEWKYAEKMVRRGKAGLSLRYDSPSVKRKIKHYLLIGLQSDMQREQGIYPLEYIMSLSKSSKDAKKALEKGKWGNIKHGTTFKDFSDSIVSASQKTKDTSAARNHLKKQEEKMKRIREINKQSPIDKYLSEHKVQPSQPVKARPVPPGSNNSPSNVLFMGNSPTSNTDMFFGERKKNKKRFMTYW